MARKSRPEAAGWHSDLRYKVRMQKIPNWAIGVLACAWVLASTSVFQLPIFQSSWVMQIVGGIVCIVAFGLYYAAIGEYAELVNKNRAVYEDRIAELMSAKEDLEWELESVRSKLAEYQSDFAKAQLRQFQLGIDEALGLPPPSE